jgi:signal transduction histidine kinase
VESTFIEFSGVGKRPPVIHSGVIVIDTSGAVIAASDPRYRARHGERPARDRLRLEWSVDGEVRRMELAGGAPLRNSGGDTVAMVFAMRRIDQDLDGVVERFSSGFNRAIWLGVPALLLATATVALFMTGRLLEPIRRLTSAARGIAAGDYGARVGATSVSELRELAHSFDGMAESLARSESARRQLMRDVAHELRTPLTNLKAQIEAMQDGLRAADAVTLASLHEEAVLLERLVADVEVLARADAGRLEVMAAPVLLGSLVRSTLNGFTSGSRLLETAASVDVPEDLAVLGDRQRLAQVLRNLLHNAVSHGGPDVTVSISARPAGPRVHLVVVDTGVGIPPEHVGRVFDRLYRADSSRTRSGAGAGLGLSIVKSLVEAQGGTVRLTSRLGEGTRVELDLPRAELQS